MLLSLVFSILFTNSVSAQTEVEVIDCQSFCLGHLNEFIFDSTEQETDAIVACQIDGCVLKNCVGFTDLLLNACNAGKDFINKGSHTFTPDSSEFKKTNFCIEGKFQIHHQMMI